MARLPVAVPIGPAQSRQTTAVGVLPRRSRERRARVGFAKLLLQLRVEATRPAWREALCRDGRLGAQVVNLGRRQALWQRIVHALRESVRVGRFERDDHDRDVVRRLVIDSLHKERNDGASW